MQTRLDQLQAQQFKASRDISTYHHVLIHAAGAPTPNALNNLAYLRNKLNALNNKIFTTGATAWQ